MVPAVLTLITAVSMVWWVESVQERMGGKKLQTRSIDESSKIFCCKGRREGAQKHGSVAGGVRIWKLQ